VLGPIATELRLVVRVVPVDSNDDDLQETPQQTGAA
jgi:hypothetical protein